MKTSRADKNRTRLADKVPINTPYVVGFWTGDVCNFKCKYCIHTLGGGIYTKNKDIIPNMMTWETFTKAADLLKEFPQPIKKVLFSSIGEPLLNKDLPDMISYVKNIGVADFCEVVTNASLLTHDLSERLVDSGLDRLCISIQGVSARKYEEISHIKLDYEKLVKEIEYFYHYSRGKCKVHIKTVDIALDDGEDKVFFDTFSDIADTINIDNVIEGFQDVDYSEMISDKTKGLYGDVQKYRLVCPSVFYTLYVLPNGAVATCCSPPYPVILGNIDEESLCDMWNGQKRMNMLLMQLSGKRNFHKVCKNCVTPNSDSFEEDNLDEERENIYKKIVSGFI